MQMIAVLINVNFHIQKVQKKQDAPHRILQLFIEKSKGSYIPRQQHSKSSRSRTVFAIAPACKHKEIF